MSEVTVSVAGESVTAGYSLAPYSTPFPAIAEVRPTVVAGEHLGTTLKRISSNARAVLDAGVYPVINNTDVNNYSIYAPKVLGIRGAGIDKTIIKVQKDSFTYKVNRPSQAGSGLMRLGPNGGASGVQRTMSDLTVLGAPQAGPDGLPMFAGGVFNYFGRDELWQRVKVRGVSYGGGNSPNTGETFMVNDYRSVRSIYEDCDFDGRDEAGNMVSASPIGFNGAVDVTMRRCYVHHALYSGLTFSIAGSVSTPTTNVYTEDCTMEWNANHPNVGSGSRFSGINHEWVRGQITHVRPTLIMDQAQLWDTNHISHGCDQIANNDVPMLVEDPRWNASPTWANGLFTIKIWGNQTTLPVVKNANGSLKKAVVAAGANPARLGTKDSDGVTITPETHFAISAGTGYVAP